MKKLSKRFQVWSAIGVLLGGAVVLASEWPSVPLAVGMGMVAYAVAVLFYSLLAVWRRW